MTALLVPFANYNSIQIFFDSSDVKDYFAQPSHLQQTNTFVYFARYGKSFDGHQFALAIVRSKNFIVGERTKILLNFQNQDEQNEIFDSKYFVCVSNVEKALTEEINKFANRHNFDFTSIGVTGTSGKTSVVQLTGQMLAALKQDVLKIGTLGIEMGETQLPNSHLTTPDYPAFISALAKAKAANINTLVMEVSSHGLAQSRLHNYKFDIAIFTNFSQDHLDFHASMDEYLKAKILLFSTHLKESSVCIISTQSSEWIQFVQNAAGKKRVLYLLIDHNLDATWQKIEHFKNDFKLIQCVYIKNKTSTLEGLSGEFCVSDIQQKKIIQQKFTSPLLGEINFENLMNVFCICLALGYSIDKFSPLFAHLKGVPGRMEKVYALNLHSHTPPVAIVDYSHKPGALESVLSTLRKLLPHNKKLITVFGCGGDRDKSKRHLMGEVATRLSDVVIVTSDNPRTEDPNKIIEQIITGIHNTTSHFIEPNRALAIQKAFEIAKESDIILIAGKGHETYQIIGNQKIDFSDVEAAKTCLANWTVI